YLKDFTLRQISREFKRRGIKTKHGRESWSICVLGAMLRNDTYLGVYRFHKSKHGKDVDGSRMKINRTDHIIAGSREKPNHPRLIEPWLFDAIQEKIAANRKKTSAGLYMATGLLRCPMCSAPMRAKYSRSGSVHAVVKYTCTNKPTCTSKRLLIS